MQKEFWIKNLIGKFSLSFSLCSNAFSQVNDLRFRNSFDNVGIILPGMGSIVMHTVGYCKRTINSNDKWKIKSLRFFFFVFFWLLQEEISWLGKSTINLLSRRSMEFDFFFQIMNFIYIDKFLFENKCGKKTTAKCSVILVFIFGVWHFFL